MKTKAQSSFYEYIIIILIGMFVLISISAMFISLQNAAIEKNIRTSLTQLAIQTSDSIVKLYDTSKDSRASPSTNSSVQLSAMDLNFPSDVSNRNYRIELVSANGIWSQTGSVNVGGVNITATNGSLIETTFAAKIVAESLQSPLVKVEYVIPNIPVVLQGFSENGMQNNLKYYRINFNGTVTDRIVLGNSSSLIDLRVVS